MLVGDRRIDSADQRLCHVLRCTQSTMKQLPLYLALQHTTSMFIGCVLRWRHLVNACEVKAYLIGCWQKPWRRLFLTAYTLSAKPVSRDSHVCLCHCCPAWQTVVCCIPYVRFSS